MSRRRQLGDDEQALWSGFARSITPLRPSRKSAKPADAVAEKSPAAPSAVADRPSPAQPRRMTPRDTAPAAPSPALAPLDRRFKQRVARGREPIEDRIDLHGMTQSQAHAALLRFLRRAQAAGARTVLVVTGKGSGKASDLGSRDAVSERGVLRRQVPLWLALPEFRLLVVGFDAAHVGHGGQGALYVRLRREK
jgi:DNA-nicking Smr family endonuclease